MIVATARMASRRSTVTATTWSPRRPSSRSSTGTKAHSTGPHRLLRRAGAERGARAHDPGRGLAEASFVTAMMLGHRFSVLTMLDRGVPPIHDLLRLHGVESRCASVRATGLTVLEAHGDPIAALGVARA